MSRDLACLAAGNRGGSESDPQDQTPDTDDSGAHSYPEPPSLPPERTVSSFKRAPVMGNRSLEQKGKKARTYPPKEAAQKVGSLLDPGYGFEYFILNTFSWWLCVI